MTERDDELTLKLAGNLFNDFVSVNLQFLVQVFQQQSRALCFGIRKNTAQAVEAALVTVAPDSIDWDDEVRLAIESRAALSPDALTGMEASLRFSGRESMLTRVFGRLSAWQNWIFIRPNAVGEQGALKVYGTGAKAKFNWERV